MLDLLTLASAVVFVSPVGKNTSTCVSGKKSFPNGIELETAL
jgi:hypothetical protein